jgi:serine/threonine-protein kinase RsbW
MDAMMMTNVFDHSFDATELDAREGIGTVVTRLRTLGLNDDRAGDVEIALAEAVNNVVEHSYPDTDARGCVGISARWVDDQLTLKIMDGGTPLEGGNMPAGREADLSVALEDLPEGGFGWFLIRQLTESVSYERQQDKNILCLIFNVAE